ncbi:hypothetical protein X777_04821 [Ooceraea biroi]|uniref:DUF4817 domain-containing protein n=1 Tax=Ooceraea biroi TaxID=2015173 RepID=A0A026WHC2_OOCBI|nr:hypothetical protein X777_04821 [Ooceraea biroi]
MPRIYSNSEYADMVFVYGFCNGNANAARREYSMRFPNRRLPHKTIFRSTFQRLRETGSFALVPRTDGTLASLRNEERSAAILQHFDNDPSSSVRRTAAKLNTSSTTIWRTVRADGRYPYHFQRVQHLLPQDLWQRRLFSYWYLTQVDRNQEF